MNAFEQTGELDRTLYWIGKLNGSSSGWEDKAAQRMLAERAADRIAVQSGLPAPSSKLAERCGQELSDAVQGALSSIDKAARQQAQ